MASLSMDDFARLQTSLMELKSAKYESDEKLKRAANGAAACSLPIGWWRSAQA